MWTLGLREGLKLEQSCYHYSSVISACVSFKGVASEDDMFLFGREGCSHFGPDLYATLRVKQLNTAIL